MTQAISSAIPSNLESLLKGAAQRVLRVALGWSLARVFAVVLGVALGMLLLDAVFGFAAWVRIGLDLVFIALLIGSVVYVVRVVRGCRYEPRRAAVLVEQRLGVQGSHLINAVQLSAGPGQAQSPALIQASIDHGDALAKTLEPTRVADTTPFKRAMRNLGVVLAVCLVVFLSAPGIYHAGIPRYLFPTDSHPPYTTLSFEVTITPDRVLFGHEATIHATVTGNNVPNQASVVFLDDDDKPTQRAPMSRARFTGESTAEQSAAQPDQSKFTLTLDRAEQTRRFYIDTPDGRSKVYKLEVLPVPQFDEVSVQYDYPAYTGWTSDNRVLDADGIRVLVGTTATFTITSNVPLGSGELTVTRALKETDSPVELPKTYKLIPRSDDPRLADVAVPIMFNAEFSIVLQAKDGTPSNAPLIGSITPIADAKPDVSITDPPATIVVPENYTVMVKIQAADDVGINGIELTRSINGWGTASVALPIEYLSVDQATAGANYEFELARLGVVPGDVITYFATAYDNRAEPNGENQSADSDVHVIQVISLDEYLEYERTKYRIEDLNDEFDAFVEDLNDLAELRDEILEEMKPLRDKIENGEALTPEDQARLAELQEQLEQFQEQAGKLREKLEARAQMPELYDFEKPYTEMLEQLAEDLAEQEERASELSEAASQLQQNPGNPQQQQNMEQRAQEFEGDQEGENGEQSPFGEQTQKMLQLTKEQLKQLEMVDKIMEQVDRLKAVIEAQRELEQRLASFQNKEELSAAEQLRARELGAEQAQVRGELTDVMRELEAAAKDAEKLLPQMSASAKELVAKIEALAVVRDMKDATRLAEAGEGRASHTAADSAADKLESLLEEAGPSLQPMPGQPMPGQPMIDGPLRLTDEMMQNAMQQMAQARGVPGLSPGQQPGQQPGRNQGPGSGMGQGGGSRAPMAVRGPNARPDDRGRQGRRNGRTGQATADGELDSASESIDAGTSEAREASGGYIAGVPQRYRDEAEAYFRRLADENR